MRNRSKPAGTLEKSIGFAAKNFSGFLMVTIGFSCLVEQKWANIFESQKHVNFKAREVLYLAVLVQNHQFLNDISHGLYEANKRKEDT